MKFTFLKGKFETKFEIFGAVDDLWLNKDTNEVVVVDYKATSNKKELTAKIGIIIIQIK